MPSGLRSRCRLFADDTISYLTITSKSDTSILQSDLDKLADWEGKWRMAFHPNKCNVISITRKRSVIQHQYTLHGHVNIGKKLKWGEHIGNICNKANGTLGFLKRNLNIASTKIKENAYKSLVRPTLEYSSTVWDPHEAKNINKIEMVQRRAARYVTNRHGNRSSVTDMLSDLKWSSLEQRRQDARLCMMYKIDNDLVAIDKENRVEYSNQAYSTRSGHDRTIKLPSCRNAYRK